MTVPSPIRVGIVPYLNMLPLVHGLDRLGVRVVSTPPSRMMRLMESGELDIGMVPVGGLVDHPEWRIVGRSMIGSRGAVKSVLALSPSPPERWKLVHPDAHSRTSNVLLRILLDGKYGVRPVLGDPIPMESWEPPKTPRADEAFLLIGTRALRWRELWTREGGTRLDLGEAWTEWTGLPFVYAVWAARPGIDPGDLMERFEVLKRRNMERLGEIISAWPGLQEERQSEAEARDYLTRHIKFDLGAKEFEGLARYYEEGLRLGLFKPGWTLSAARGLA